MKRRERNSQRREEGCAQFAAGSSTGLRNVKWLKVGSRRQLDWACCVQATQTCT